MRISYENLDEGLVGKILRGFSHAGEESWERDRADRYVDESEITEVREYKGGFAVVVGSQKALVAQPRPDDRSPAEWRKDPERYQEEHLGGVEYGIGPGGWVEVSG